MSAHGRVLEALVTLERCVAAEGVTTPSVAQLAGCSRGYARKVLVGLAWADPPFAEFVVRRRGGDRFHSTPQGRELVGVRASR